MRPIGASIEGEVVYPVVTESNLATTIRQVLR